MFILFVGTIVVLGFLICGVQIYHLVQ